MVDIEKYFPMRFILFTEAEMLFIQKKEDMTKVQVKKYIFYFELSSKYNVDILGITVSMCKRRDFVTIFTYNYVIKIQDAIGKLFGSIERSYYMGVTDYFGPRRKNRPNATTNYGPGKYKYEINYYRQTYLLGIVTKWEGEMVLRNAPMEGHITVCTMPLYWRKERSHGRLGVTLT